MQCPRHPRPPYRHHHLRHESPSPFFTLSLSSHHQPHILRTHNSHSSSLLSSPLQTPPNDAVLPHQHIPALLEPSQPFPRFPGSVHVEPPFILEENGYDDDGVVLRAVEIKRRVTREILINELSKKGKFGITYATNLCASCGGFVDLVMIEAAAMKKLNEFCGSSFNDRVRWFIEESGVVPLVRWFKHNSLSYLQIGRLINMSRGDLERVRLLAEWLKSIHVNGRFIGVVFVRVGESILGRAMEELDEIIVYLESNGVRKDWMGYAISRCPEVLAFSMDEVRTRVRFYMDMGMNEHDFGTMVFDCPKVLGYFSLEEMKQQVNYIKEFGLSDEDVGRLLAFKPQLMVCSIEERWKPLIKYLYYLGIGRDGLRRVLVIKPMVFCVDLETTIAPKVRFLQDLGIKEDAIGRMLVKFPPLLTYSLYKKIRPVVVFLLTKAGVTEKNIAKVIALAPELLGCSIAHKLDGNVKYFLSLGISLRQLGKMIADFPMLLRYNVELLRPKYRYLRRTMVRPLQDLIEFPRFFSYSLEERIIPRHKVMVENRVNFELRYMLASTDAEFNQRVRDTVEQRQRFDSGILSEVY